MYTLGLKREGEKKLPRKCNIVKFIILSEILMQELLGNEPVTDIKYVLFDDIIN